ncbi:MAG: hypothetical protein ACYDBQ_03730 [Thermoplasmatota archaeon]
MARPSKSAASRKKVPVKAAKVPAKAKRVASAKAPKASSKATKAPAKATKGKPSKGKSAPAAPDKAHCVALDTWGEPCQNIPRLGSTYCLVHSNRER